MANLFDSIRVSNPQYNVFDLSHDHKTTLNMGFLCPTMLMECSPGDKFNIGCESLIRFQPLIAPVMHRMDVYNHYFFVPFRILWPNWENYITNTKIGSPTPALPAFPTLEISTGNYTSLHDYMGIPDANQGGDVEIVSAMPFAAYQMIYNEYYRDQNLIEPVDFELIDGDNSLNVELSQLRKRAWSHDYFTSALPFAQKGDPVSIPIGQLDDVQVFVQNTALGSGSTTLTAAPANVVVGRQDSTSPGIQDGLWAETSELDLGSTTINDLTRAQKLQQWLEMAARSGSRLVEMLWARFKVKKQDARLQRPEYVTGTKSPVMVSEVLNSTGPTGATEDLPQGNMSGHGIATVNGKYGFYDVKEHGYLICITSVLPLTAYGNGIEKLFYKINDPFDFFWREFGHLGEQAIENRELMAFMGAPGFETFGYTPRYAEYKYMNNRVSKDMRTNLSFWHLARQFTTTPVLNQSFIEADPRTDIFAVTELGGVDHLIVHILHKIRAVRQMPKFGTPIH